MSKEMFNKLLVSRYSPKNGCFVEDGKVLSIVPLKNFPKGKNIFSHHFIDPDEKSIKSKFGWVKDVDPFTIEDFIKKYTIQEIEDESELEYLKIMLSSIKNLKEDTAVGATYKTRLENYKPTMVLLIHKVKFY